MWGVEKPEPEKLPRLRSSSDITWGLWSHMASNNLANINYFMATFIVNTESVTNIVPAALKAKGVADGRPLEWPGTDFHVAEQDKELRKAFQALVGKSSVSVHSRLFGPSVVDGSRFAQCPGSRLLPRSAQETTRPEAHRKSSHLEGRQGVFENHSEYADLRQGRPAARAANGSSKRRRATTDDPEEERL
jgi:hypothetical protein